MSVTGWRAKVVEFFQSISTTQHLNHIRPNKATTLSIRNVSGVETINTAFDENAHTVDVLDSSARQTKYKTNKIGMFIWRLNSYGITNAMPLLVTQSPGNYTFNPTGLDIPLFNRPQLLQEFTDRVTNINVPEALSFAAFADDLQYYQKLYPTPPANLNTMFYGPDRSLCLFREENGETNAIPINELISMDLSTWTKPPIGKIAVDVTHGRIALAEGASISNLKLNYSYGFSADLGGGPYNRKSSLAINNAENYFRVNKSLNNNLNTAFTAWLESDAKESVIQITDNGIYDEAINWNIELEEPRILYIEAADGYRPTLRSDIFNITVTGSQLTLYINGLLIDSALKTILSSQSSVNLFITHTTLVPKPHRISLQADTIV